MDPVLATTIFGFTLGLIWWVFLVFLWVVLAFLPANISRSKGHGFWGMFFLSLFFWWITLFVALFMRDRNRAQPSPSAAEPAEE